MSINLFIIMLLSMLAGASKGICDSIQFHDGYASKGYFWSKASWKQKYNNPTWLSKLMNASINAWHVFDWIRNICYFLSAFLIYFIPEHSFFELVGFMFFNVFFFLITFQLFYR